MKQKMRLKRLLSSLLLALVLSVLTTTPLLAATTADVTITWTPTYIAMTNSVSSWEIGTIIADTVYWWTNDGNAPNPEPFEDADMKSTITNTGSVAEDIDIHTHNATGGSGCAVSTDDTPAGDEFSLRAGITGTTNAAAMIQVTTTDTELVNNLAASGTKLCCMRFKSGTPSDGVAKSTTATLTASTAD